MSKPSVWDHIVKDLAEGNDRQMRITPIEPQWLFYYDDGHRKMIQEHGQCELTEVLRMFEEFCKGAGFVFSGFAIVDEDGIPTHGLHPIARLEADDEDPGRI